MILGLTGGICTGKSVAAAALVRLGLHVIDCDVIAHFLSEYDPGIRAAIGAEFAAAAFLPNGALDRRSLATLVFSDAEARARLEQILHPPILEIVSSNVAAAREVKQHLVVVVPLLFELSMQENFDQTWVISCSLDEQRRRLQARSGLTEHDAELRIKTQMRFEERAAFASRVIGNDGTIGDLERAVQSAWEQATPV